MTVVHRHGRIAPGERIVLVAVAAAHRGAAFAAAEMLMDYLKTARAVLEARHQCRRRLDGWVDAKGDDERSAARWSGAGLKPASGA